MSWKWCPHSCGFVIGNKKEIGTSSGCFWLHPAVWGKQSFITPSDCGWATETNFIEIHCMFKTCWINWHVPYKRPNLPMVSEMVLLWSWLKILWTFSMSWSLQPVRRQPESSHSSTEIELRKPPKSRVKREKPTRCN